MSTYSN